MCVTILSQSFKPQQIFFWCSYLKFSSCWSVTCAHLLPPKSTPSRSIGKRTLWCQKHKDQKNFGGACLRRWNGIIITSEAKQIVIMLIAKGPEKGHTEGHKTICLVPKKAWNHYHKIFKVAPIFLIPQLFHPSIVWWSMLTWWRRPNFFFFGDRCSRVAAILDFFILRPAISPLSNEEYWPTWEHLYFIA